jgi:hypothetical protein
MKPCKGFNVNSNIQSIRRYFARINIFDNGVGYVAGSKLGRSNLHDVKRDSLYMLDPISLERKGFTRLQIQRGNIDGRRAVRVLLNNVEVSADLVQFLYLRDRDTAPFVSQCWSDSKFVVYVGAEKCLLDRLTDKSYSRLRKPNSFIEYCVLTVVTTSLTKPPTMRHCLVLPWFDRFDRLTFWKVLKDFYDFHSREILSFIATAAIFIQEYL